MAPSSSQEPSWISLITAPDIVGADVEDFGQEIFLRAEEEIYVSGMGDIRRRDFALGRHCAHVALDRLGVRQCTIAREQGGAPIWPADITGSITHTRGYSAAVVGKKVNFGGVGVDAERVTEILEEYSQRLFVLDEQAYLAELEAPARHIAATILFSAKESYYKASSTNIAAPLFRALRVDLGRNVFSVSQEGVKKSPRAMGKFAVVGDLVLTTISIPPGFSRYELSD